MVRKVSTKRKKELRKKIPQIQSGLGTRPPKEWWNSMRKIIEKGYPGRGKQAVDRITAGIWHSYSPQAKMGIIRRLSAGTGGIPRKMNPLTSEESNEVLKRIRTSLRGVEASDQEDDSYRMYYRGEATAYKDIYNDFGTEQNPYKLTKKDYDDLEEHLARALKETLRGPYGREQNPYLGEPKTKAKVGDRIKIISVVNDPTLKAGDIGIVLELQRTPWEDQIWVKWDNGYQMALLEGVDEYEVISRTEQNPSIDDRYCDCGQELPSYEDWPYTQCQRCQDKYGYGPVYNNTGML